MIFLIIILVLLVIIYGASIVMCYLIDAPKGMTWKPLINTIYCMSYKKTENGRKRK